MVCLVVGSLTKGFSRVWIVVLLNHLFNKFLFSGRKPERGSKDILSFVLKVSVGPHLKTRYHDHLERVRGYLETIKDFDELISPQSLFLHFLGLEPSSQVQKNVEVAKKSKWLGFILISLQTSLQRSGMYGFVHLLGMATRFRKGKLSKIQEKKAKTRLKEGLLLKKQKKDNEPLQEDIVVVSSFLKPAVQCLASPTSSLKLITPTDEDNVDAAILKAHDTIAIEDLEPLTTESFQELMSSHVHKIMQVLGESLYLLGKYLAYEKKLASSVSQVESLSSKNAMLKEKVSSLKGEAKETQEHLKALEKDVSTEKTFSRLKDKQIEEALARIPKLCDYYVEGFDPFHKYLAKHHPELDFSKLDMDEVEREILANHPSEATVENVEEMEGVASMAPTNLSSSNLP
ncbi:hypothetical protein SO802_006087 [Lithocarpus litseifolius]|uniref:Uncharacterized protein n=1 Tax=Lithocarpus litseifolius TaxID=425828 RepID=A0AAW2DLE8_9ROSI